MSFLKDFKELKKDVAEIKAALSDDYLSKADELAKIKGFLPQIRFKVKNIVDTIDETGKPALKIMYEIDPVLLVFDDNREPLLNERFRSINELDLISFDDKLLILENINRKKI